MRVVLYENFSENHAIGKKITEIATVQAKLKEQTSALDIILELKTTADIIDNVNYLHVPKLNRKYFVVDKDLLTNGIIAVQCHVDVLDSFRSDIRALKVIASKVQESDSADLYIDDNSYITQNRLTNDIYNFPGGFNDAGQFILITVGG